MLLQSYSFYIEYVPIKENVTADFLSRHPIEIEGKETDQKRDLRHHTPLLDSIQKFCILSFGKGGGVEGGLCEEKFLFSKINTHFLIVYSTIKT